MTTIGRFSPNKVRERVLSGRWAVEDDFASPSASVLISPPSISYTSYGSSSASIGDNGTVSFTSCTSISLNSIFSSSYSNYMITIRHENIGGDDLLARLRSGTTDDLTLSSYVSQIYKYLAYDAGPTASRSTTDYWSWTSSSTDFRAMSNSFIFGPFIAQPTAFRSDSMDSKPGVINAGYYGTLYRSCGTHNQSTSYNGITFFPLSSSALISGTISIYGLIGV